MSEAQAAGAPAPAPGVPARPPGTGAGGFVGRARPFMRIVARGSLLLLLTLGLYRFWLVTDIRRYLFANGQIADDGLEYIGTARELLLGFLIAIVILIPVNVGILIAALDLGLLGRVSGVLAFVLLALLGQFAIYRARRYRLTRTVYRGLRFYQDGSAWRYAVCALFWWGLTFLTFGLAYPFAQASLERLKMRHTFYGDLPGRFEGSGFRLFLRGLPLWFVVMGPLVFGLSLMVVAVDWPVILEAAEHGGGDVLARIEGASPGLGSALAVGVMAVLWGVVAAAMLYPAFQAIVLRWWLSGLRFGSVSVASSLRVREVYGIYVRFLWYSLLLALVAGIIALAGFAGVGAVVNGAEKSEMVEIAATGLLVLGYVVVALAYSAIYQMTVRFDFWRLGFATLTLTGIQVLDRVGARGEAGSPVGEGLADALQVGGI